VNATSPLIDKCSIRYHSGQTFTRSNGTAGTFEAGVDLKKVIGISLSAKSGYDKNVSIKYTFPSGGYLCGSNNYPSAAAWDIMSPCDQQGNCVASASAAGTQAGRRLAGHRAR
jgi:hypothetical protein